jgi:endonuclease/exonuclease/phosphatase (EEP) superfamily protein YafD
VPPTRRLVTAAALVALLAPALLLTVLRLLQPDVGWAVRAVSFAPYALPCYAAAAVVLGVVSGRAVRDRRRRRWATAHLTGLLLVVALLVVHLSWVWPSLTDARTTVAPDSPRLRVMTLNVLHEAGTGAVVRDAVREADGDVVALHEVTDTIWREVGDTDLARSHPHVVGLDSAGDHETVVLSRLPLGRWEPLPTDGDSLVVQVRLGSDPVELMAVHPRNPLHPTLWRDDHAALLAAVRRFRPAVVAGDFNATFDHAQMRGYRDLGYRSAAELLGTGWQPTWPNNGYRELFGLAMPRLVHIDHVLVGPGRTAVSVEHLDVPRTDHMGVVAEVAEVADMAPGGSLSGRGPGGEGPRSWGSRARTGPRRRTGRRGARPCSGGTPAS